MSRTTITLPSDVVEELTRVLGARSKTEAVLRAVKDEIRARKLERIKSMAGRMEFVKTAKELRHGDDRIG
jgi:hypothetical protein